MENKNKLKNVIKSKKKKSKKRKNPQEFNCTNIVNAQAFVQEQDQVFGFNWVEVLCYPYILCGKIWECCIGICAGTNVCLLCWLVLQWIMCKISAFGSPDPVMFPYYFYIFCQVVLMTLVFVGIWLFFGKPVIYPYLMTIYADFLKTEKGNVSRRLSLKRYCFKKSEIFDTNLDSGASAAVLSAYAYTISIALCLFVYSVFK